MTTLNSNQIEMARTAINLANMQLEEGTYESVQLATYMLCELDAVKEAGLTDLAWALHECNTHKNDVLSLIEHLEKYLNDVEKVA